MPMICRLMLQLVGCLATVCVCVYDCVCLSSICGNYIWPGQLAPLANSTRPSSAWLPSLYLTVRVKWFILASVICKLCCYVAYGTLDFFSFLSMLYKYIQHWNLGAASFQESLHSRWFGANLKEEEGWDVMNLEANVFIEGDETE